MHCGQQLNANVNAASTEVNVLKVLVRRSTLRALMKVGLNRLGYKLVRIRPTVGDRKPSAQSAPHERCPSSPDIAFRTSTWRYLVPMGMLVGRPCFSYAPESWHPYVATLRETLDQGRVGYEDSVLARFFGSFSPASIAEATSPPDGFNEDHTLCSLDAATLFEPWLLREPPHDDPRSPACRPSGSPLFGPVTRSEGEFSYRRLHNALSSIQRYGYRPDFFKNGRIGICILRHDSSVRYLVIHGQHRVAALSALGAKWVEVCAYPGLPPVVDSADVDRWPYVQRGLVSRDCAVAMLRRYFVNDGWQVGKSLS